jgi:hypothetical protein
MSSSESAGGFGSSAATQTGGPVRPIRQPLGLPAGSVRALLTLMVFGIVWTLMLQPEEKHVGIPLFLFYLMFLILGHYFAAHGNSIRGQNTGSNSPLHLPRGSIRTVIFLGFAGVIAYRYYVYRDVEKLFVLEKPLVEQPYLPFVLVGAFFLGLFISRTVGRMVMGPSGQAGWFQDVQAWIALVATVILVVLILILFVINPSVEPDLRVDVPTLECVCAAIISLYFGMRS